MNATKRTPKFGFSFLDLMNVTKRTPKFGLSFLVL